jgi:phosphate transport system ATP-binding protein
MEIEKNKITALIGPSGCGKSTFVRTLNRMNDEIDSVMVEGNIEIDEQDIYGDIDIIKLRSRVGMVFQKPNPFPMSIYDNVAYGPRAHGIRKKSILDELVENNPETARQCTYFIFIAKYLERMGDHATNIAEWIGFTVTGNHDQV